MNGEFFNKSLTACCFSGERGMGDDLTRTAPDGGSAVSNPASLPFTTETVGTGATCPGSTVATEVLMETKRVQMAMERNATNITHGKERRIGIFVLEKW